MTTLQRALRAALILGLSAAFASGALAATTVKMSYNGPPDAKNNAVHAFAENLKELIEKGTQGRVLLELYPDSQLGSEEERMELLMKTGLNQPMANIASFAGIAPVFPEIYASSVPFMFNSYEAAHRFFDGSRYWTKAKDEFRARTGAVLLEAVEEGGFLAFTNSKRALRSPKDFQGLKFRGMDEGQLAIYKAFGASGTPIPWTELYMALKTNVVDGQMNPAMYIIIGSLFEVQQYMTLANIQYSDQFLVMNGDLFDALSPEDQRAVVAAAKEANRISRAQVEAADASQVAFLSSKGMKVYAPSAKEMKEFREVGQPGYLEWLRQTVDGQWLDLALECASKANEAVGK